MPTSPRQLVCNQNSHKVVIVASGATPVSQSVAGHRESEHPCPADGEENMIGNFIGKHLAQENANDEEERAPPSKTLQNINQRLR